MNQLANNALEKRDRGLVRDWRHRDHDAPTLLVNIASCVIEPVGRGPKPLLWGCSEIGPA